MINISSYILPLAETFSLKTSDPVGRIPSTDRGVNEGIPVFDPRNNFVGLLPLRSLFGKPQPSAGTISGLSLIHPPEITGQSTSWEVIVHMLSLRMYTLPVVDPATGAVSGVITAKQIVSQLLSDPTLLRLLSGSLSIREPITLSESAKIRDVYSIMRKDDNNRAVVVSATGRLIGMLTQQELFTVMLTQATSNRSKKHGGKKNSPFFGSGNKPTLDKSVKTYMVTDVSTVRVNDPWESVLRELLASKNHTVVVVSVSNIPEGIVTMRDVLLTLRKLEPEYQVPLMITDQQKLLSSERRLGFELAVRKFSRKISKRLDVRQIILNLSPVKDTEHHIKFYILSLEVQIARGKTLRCEKQGHLLIKTLKECERAIFSQLRKIR